MSTSFMVYHDDVRYSDEHGERSLGTVTADTPTHAREKVMKCQWATRTTIPLIHGINLKFVKVEEESFLDDL